MHFSVLSSLFSKCVGLVLCSLYFISGQCINFLDNVTLAHSGQLNGKCSQLVVHVSSFVLIFTVILGLLQFYIHCRINLSDSTESLFKFGLKMHGIYKSIEKQSMPFDTELSCCVQGILYPQTRGYNEIRVENTKGF